MADVYFSEKTLRAKLENVARQLRRWATQSKTGGWSTHQVIPMRELADEIDEMLEALKR